jgi:MoaA/NifB/PqqE/SkfB family radical SAM enzyme
MHRQKHENFDKRRIFAELDAMFRIVDHCGLFVPFGGEPLLHPDIDEIIREFKKYEDKIDLFRICTNGTIVPRQSTIDALKALKCTTDLRFSEYGALSNRTEEAVRKLAANGIEATVISYGGDDQYFGGWVDFRVGDDYKGYSEEKLQLIHSHCNYANQIVGLDGKLYQCNIQSFGVHMGHIELCEEDYVDLFSNEPLEAKREKVQKIGLHPSEACKYCNSFDVESGKRVSAAIQLEKSDG